MVKIENEYLLIEVNPFGAELERIYNKKNGTDYLWRGSDEYWKGKSPVLFPFVGRLKDGKYVYDGKEYEIGIHGFAKRVNFSTHADGDRIICKYDEKNESYPFSFSLTVSYILDGQSVIFSSSVKNEDNKTMHYGFGYHPGFNVPLADNLSFEDYYVFFPESENVERKLFGPNFLDSGERVPFALHDKKLSLAHSLFDNDCVLLHKAGNILEIKSDKDEKKIRVSYPEFENVGLWHPMKTDAPFVCIEPWYSMPGREGEVTDIEKKEDFIHLPSGCEKTLEIKVEIF